MQPVKKLPVFMMIALISCSKPGETNLSSGDSTTTIQPDTTGLVEWPDTGYTEPGDSTEMDGSLLDEMYEKANQQVQERNGFFYEVSSQTNNYESMSSVTWYFDSTFSVVYYKDDWSMEGQEGASEIFLADDRIICYSSDESGGSSRTSIKVCEGTGGKMVTEEEGQETPTEEALSDSYLEEARKELDGNLGRLISFLRDTEVTDKSDAMYTIRVENTANYGIEVTESSEVSIPKALYEKLLE
jgi:hypothetical protein